MNDFFYFGLVMYVNISELKMNAEKLKQLQAQVANVSKLFIYI